MGFEINDLKSNYSIAVESLHAVDSMTTHFSYSTKTEFSESLDFFVFWVNYY